MHVRKDGRVVGREIKVSTMLKLAYRAYTTPRGRVCSKSLFTLCQDFHRCAVYTQPSMRVSVQAREMTKVWQPLEL